MGSDGYFEDAQLKKEILSHLQSGSFSLPGRKALLKSDMEFEVILIDATESPIERSKKKSKAQKASKK